MTRHAGGGLVKQLGSRHGEAWVVKNAILIIHLEKVDIMAHGMDGGADQNGVCRNLVEPDSLIDRDQLVQERDAKDAEDVTADWEQDDGAIPDKTDSTSTSDPKRITQGDVEIVEFGHELDTEETKDEESDMNEQPDYEEDVTASRPRLERLEQGHSVSVIWSLSGG